VIHLKYSTKTGFGKIFASAVALVLLAIVVSGCETNATVPAAGPRPTTEILTTAPALTTPTITTQTTTTSPTTTTPTITTSPNTSLPATIAPPVPLSNYPILGDAYNPPDPGQPANSFYVDAYELRPNLLFVKAGTWVTWVNQDNKSLFVTSMENLFFGVTSPLGLSWSYRFDSPGVFAFSISPYNATEIGVIVVTA
jgi:hypothetical protein